MNKEEIIEEIKSDFGYPTVKVELTEEHWEPIIKKAKRWFQARKGLIGCYRFPVANGHGQYEIPADSYNVLDVVTPGGASYADLFGLCGITDLIPASPFGYSQSSNFMMFDASSYVLLLQTLDQRSRALGVDKNWFESCGKLHLYSTGTGLALMFYKRKAWEVEELVGRDEEMFYRYCLALTKKVIGRIRVKYSNYPTAGGTITMDGDSLLSEAEKEMEALNEEIFGSQGNSGGIAKG